MNSRAPNEKIVLPAATRPENLLNFSGRRRVPVIVQAERAECGLACLAMVAGYYGFTTDLNSLRRRFALSTHGSSVQNVMDMATRLNLAPRVLRAEVEGLPYMQLPCILHWSFNHFVVLTAIKNNTYTLHDPAIGERVIDAKTFSNEFTGLAIEFTPTQEFKKGEDVAKLKISHFWSNIVGLKRSLLQVVALSFLLELFAIASPFYMQTLVDDVLQRQDTNLLLVLSLGFGLLMLIQIGTSTLRQFVMLYMSSRLSMQMSANLFRHLIRLPLDYFAKRHMGDIVSRFGAQGAVRGLLTQGIVATVIDGVMALVTLTVLLVYSLRLTAIVIGVVLIYGLLRWAMYRPFRLLTEESIITGAKEGSHFMESIRAVQTIKLFQRENDRQSDWQNKLADVMNKNIQIARWGIGYGVLASVLFGVENILVLYFAATDVMGNVMSLGMLYAFMSYKSQFIGAMNSLISQWIEYKMLGLYLNRVADIAFTPTENIDSHAPANGQAAAINAIASQIKGKIEVRNLGYRYAEGEAWAFRDVNFVINPGETVAITGPSGCGKTTLLKCLMGLMQPSTGEILIDDKPLHTLPHYRSQIAAVMQDDQLLSGDVASNIACFAPQMDMERIQACARMACIHEEIEYMPMAYYTLVGELGTGLSGGQKQRIIVARALYRQPRLLFMDEATSHLDVHNEAVVNHHIQQLDITRVIVAHRPETVRSAGRQINLARHGGVQDNTNP